MSSRVDVTDLMTTDPVFVNSSYFIGQRAYVTPGVHKNGTRFVEIKIRTCGSAYTDLSAGECLDIGLTLLKCSDWLRDQDP